MFEVGEKERLIAKLNALATETAQELERPLILISEEPVMSRRRIKKLFRNIPKEFIDFYIHVGDREVKLYGESNRDDDDRACSYDSLLPVYGEVSIEELVIDYYGRIPSWLFPFSQPNWGDVYCLSTRESDFGVVYIWDHHDEFYVSTWGLEEELDDETYLIELDKFERNLRKVAESFKEAMFAIEATRYDD